MNTEIIKTGKVKKIRTEVSLPLIEKVGYNFPVFIILNNLNNTAKPK